MSVVLSDLRMPRTKGIVIGFWIVTALFCLQIGFTAYAQLCLPQVAEAFTHLGFPAYFRVELCVGQAPRSGAAACAGAGEAQRVGIRRLRYQPRLGDHRPPRGGRWPGGVGLGGGHRGALGAFVLLLAPPAGHAGERLTTHTASLAGASGAVTWTIPQIEGTPMKIKLTSVYVDDQEKALRFYTEVLGFAKKADFSQGPYRWLTVASPEDPDGTELQLALNDNPAAKAYQQAMFQQGQPAAMFFSDDVKGDYSASKRAAPSSPWRQPRCPARPSPG